MTVWDVLSNIPARAPVWVWPLLIWMIWVGVRAMRDRTIATRIYWALPFFALMSVRGRLDTAVPEVDLPVFAAAYFIGVAFGAWFQGRVIVAKTGDRVTVKGETLTLAMLMAIFWMNFAQGVMAAAAPDLMRTGLMVGLLAGIVGAVSGQFAGRALRVLRAPQGVFRRSGPQVPPGRLNGNTP